jgi:hypothetical protein
MSVEARPATLPGSEVSVRMRMPVRQRYRMRFVKGERVVELDLMLCSRAEWSRRPESSLAAWNVWCLGPLVLAASLTD